ncbi:MAG: HDOD domain-containing protein [bacterium]|nr:HDOD domain-containing protein [bacterium]
MSTASQPAEPCTLGSPRAELILAQLEQLPTLPAVATRLLEVTTSDASSASDVAAIIEMDQALTAKVLALVRSASVGAREASTVSRAIVLLGFESVRNAVLAVQVYETFRSVEPQDGAGLDREEFWKHSLAVACASRLVAERMDLRKRSGEAFVCGLLHDLGKMALDACLPKSYARVLQQTRASGRCLCDVESELLGVDHTVAGKRLTVRWKLPQPIVDCVWLHHAPPGFWPDSEPSAEMLRVVHVADQIVRHQRIGFSGYAHLEPLDTVAREVGLDPGEIQPIIQALPEEIERNCELVGLNGLSGTEMYAQAVSEANAELGRVNIALATANRRLGVRARCFDALGRFTRDLSLDDSVATTCQTAAKCVREVLEVETAVGFFCDAGGTVYHAGASTTNGDWIDVFSGSKLSATDERCRSGRSAVVGGATSPAPPMAEPVLQHFESAPWSGLPRMWPITHGGVVIGGVLYRGECDSVELIPPAPSEIEALAVAFGLAVAGAVDRTRSERLYEGLARANRQLHEARAELIRTKSIASIAEVAAGAAHEVNNPLAVISGRAQMLAKSVEDEEQKRAAEIIQEHAARASAIIGELVGYAKPDPPDPKVIPMAEWLEGLRQQWEASSGLKPGQLDVTLSDRRIRACADPDQLRRIFDALLANAAESTGSENARLRINSDSATSDDRIVVRVEDNGAGMAPEVLEHAADPFFSHRAAGRGRGMGLSQATRLAANNGGRLWLESTPGVGTTAYVELPAAR